jgi:deazaflavin-dependent oxidoreductase (nitroreductase family)
MPSGAKDAVVRVRSALHRAAFARSGGRLLATWSGQPVVLLTTTGRRSGVPRTTIVVAPVRLGDTLVLIASDGGAPRHPAWYLNLRARPEAEVLFGRRRRRMLARTAGPAERAALWPQVTASSPSYARYQARCTRELPIVLLEPDPRVHAGEARTEQR